MHKTEAHQAEWGGVVSDESAGQFDPCYHEACDTFPDNINDEVLAVTSDAVAHSVLTFAQTTSAVNGTGKASEKATKSFDWKGNKLRR